MADEASPPPSPGLDASNGDGDGGGGGGDDGGGDGEPGADGPGDTQGAREGSGATAVAEEPATPWLVRGGGVGRKAGAQARSAYYTRTVPHSPPLSPPPSAWAHQPLPLQHHASASHAKRRAALGRHGQGPQPLHEHFAQPGEGGRLRCCGTGPRAPCGTHPAPISTGATLENARAPKRWSGASDRRQHLHQRQLHSEVGREAGAWEAGARRFPPPPLLALASLLRVPVPPAALMAAATSTLQPWVRWKAPSSLFGAWCGWSTRPPLS